MRPRTPRRDRALRTRHRRSAPAPKGSSINASTNLNHASILASPGTRFRAIHNAPRGPDVSSADPAPITSGDGIGDVRTSAATPFIPRCDNPPAPVEADLPRPADGKHRLGRIRTPRGSQRENRLETFVGREVGGDPRPKNRWPKFRLLELIDARRTSVFLADQQAARSQDRLIRALERQMPSLFVSIRPRSKKKKMTMDL